MEYFSKDFANGLHVVSSGHSNATPFMINKKWKKKLSFASIMHMTNIFLYKINLKKYHVYLKWIFESIINFESITINVH